MRRIAQVCLGLCMCWLTSCSSSDSTGGAGGSAGTTGSPGPGDCFAVECFRAFNCVSACGGPVMKSGCCACQAPLFDNLECANDAGKADSASGPGDASIDSTSEQGATRACDMAECFRANECVRQCGGAVEYAGCCACDAPLFDRLQCDGGK